MIQLLKPLIPSGVHLPILRGPLRGCRWYVGAAAGPTGGLSLIAGAGELAQMKKSADVIRSEYICFDIGANVGLYSLLFARRAKTVYAFEPMPRNLAWLYRTVTVNRLSNVRIIPAAISCRTEWAAFQEGTNCALGHLAAGGQQPVATITLDDFVGKYAVVPDVIKIDVEGAEVDVLRGGTDCLQTRHPQIFLSCHSAVLREECLQLATVYGYKRIDPLDHTTPQLATEFYLSRQ